MAESPSQLQPIDQTVNRSELGPVGQPASRTAPEGGADHSGTSPAAAHKPLQRLCSHPIRSANFGLAGDTPEHLKRHSRVGHYLKEDASLTTHGKDYSQEECDRERVERRFKRRSA